MLDRVFYTFRPRLQGSLGSLLALLMAFSVLLFLSGCASKTEPGRMKPPVVRPGQVPPPVVVPIPIPAPVPEPVVEPEPEVLRVLILLPLSGTHQAVGDDILKAAQMALFDLKSSRLNLVVRDTGGTPEGVTRALADVPDLESVSLILGPLLSPEVERLRAQKPPYIPAIAFTTDTRWAAPNLYIMGQTPENQYRSILRVSDEKILNPLMVVELQNKLAQTLAGTPVPQGLKVQIAPYRGKESLLTLAFALQNARGVVLPAGGAEAKAVAAELRHHMSPGVPFLGFALWNTPEILSDPVFEGAWFVNFDTRHLTAFSARFEKLYDHAPHILAPLGYDAVALAAGLAKNTSSGFPYTSDRLENPEGFSGVNGLFRFRSTGAAGIAGGVAEYALATYEIRGGQPRLLAEAPQNFLS